MSKLGRWFTQGMMGLVNMFDDIVAKDGPLDEPTKQTLAVVARRFARLAGGTDTGPPAATPPMPGRRPPGAEVPTRQPSGQPQSADEAWPPGYEPQAELHPHLVALIHKTVEEALKRHAGGGKEEPAEEPPPVPEQTPRARKANRGG